MRYIGVDLHKTNFVVCFIEADDARRLETYPLNGDGLARFKLRLNASDELAVFRELGLQLGLEFF